MAKRSRNLHRDAREIITRLKLQRCWWRDPAHTPHLSPFANVATGGRWTGAARSASRWSGAIMCAPSIRNGP